MKHKLITFSIITMLTSTAAFANTAQEARLIEQALRQFQNTHTNLVSLDNIPCTFEVVSEIRTDNSRYHIHIKLNTVTSNPAIFDIRGPRITGVFQSFEVFQTPEEFLAVVTNSDSDGYGYWHKDMRRLKIGADFISLEIKDLIDSSSQTIVCKADNL